MTWSQENRASAATRAAAASRARVSGSSCNRRSTRRERGRVPGRHQAGVDVVRQPRRDLRDIRRDDRTSRGEVLGELQRRVVERLVPATEHERDIHRRECSGRSVCGDGSGEHDGDALGACELLDPRPFGSVADEQEGRVLDSRERGDRLVECVEAPEAADPADDEPPVQPEPLAHRGADRLRVGTERERVEVDAGRRDEDRFRSARRCGAPVRRRARCRTRRRRPRAGRAPHPHRSATPRQPGRRVPHCSASHTWVAGTKSTEGTPSSRARSTPAVWNSSWRCHTNARSRPR